MNLPSLSLTRYEPFKYTRAVGRDLQVICRWPANTLLRLTQKIACLVAISFFLLLTCVFELLLIPISLACRCWKRISLPPPPPPPVASGSPTSSARVLTAGELDQAKKICFRVAPRIQFILHSDAIEVDGEHCLKQAVDVALEFLPPEKVASMKQFLAGGGDRTQFDLNRWIAECTLLRCLLSRQFHKVLCPNYLEPYWENPYRENGLEKPSLKILWGFIETLEWKSWASLIFQTYNNQITWQMGPMAKGLYEHIQFYGQRLSTNPLFIQAIARAFPPPAALSPIAAAPAVGQLPLFPELACSTAPHPIPPVPPGRILTAEEIHQAMQIDFRENLRIQFTLSPFKVDKDQYLRGAVDVAFKFLPPEKVAYAKKLLAEGGMGGAFEVYRWIGACTVLRCLLTRQSHKVLCPNYLEPFRATPYQEENGVVRPSLANLGVSIDNLDWRAWASLIFQTYDIQTEWQMGPETKSFYEHIQAYGQFLARDPGFIDSIAGVFPITE
ncbi:MAG TPA: hypothetical protein VLE89_07775 [Chlamydiales bacterium]|nr:hypothetical protein [Chlamydiales bacterium]